MSENDSVVVIGDGTALHERQSTRSQSNLTNAEDVIILDSPTHTRPRRRRNRENVTSNIVDLTCFADSPSISDLVDLTNARDSISINASSSSDLVIVDVPSSTTSQSERSKKRRVDRTHANPDQADDTAAILRLNCPVCLESLQTLLKNGVELRSTVCGHVFCQNCIRIAIRSSKKCPTCRKKLNEKQTHPLYLPIG